MSETKHTPGRNTELSPVDGKWRVTKEERDAACKAMGHPLIHLNLTLSAKLGRDIFRCHCGEARTA